MRTPKRTSAPIRGWTLVLRLCGYAATLGLWTYDFTLFAMHLR